MIIESKENKLIKYAKKLQDKKFSKTEQKTLVESPKIVKELLDICKVDYLLVAEKFLREFDNFDKVKVYTISDSVIKYLSQTETSTGVFAVVKLPDKINSIENKLLILDNIQDPTNYGSICRSAVAFGFKTIIDINCTYAYSPKVTRCSMGNNFKCNIIQMDYESLFNFCESNNIELICCDMSGKDIKNSRPTSDKFAIIIGNEGNGVSEILRNKVTQIISIPMDSNVESLNASVSAGIVMYNYKDF